MVELAELTALIKDFTSVWQVTIKVEYAAIKMTKTVARKTARCVHLIWQLVTHKVTMLCVPLTKEYVARIELSL